MSIYFHLLSSKQGKAGRLGDTMLFSLFIQAHVFPGKNKTRLGQKLFQKIFVISKHHYTKCGDGAKGGHGQ